MSPHLVVYNSMAMAEGAAFHVLAAQAYMVPCTVHSCLVCFQFRQTLSDRARLLLLFIAYTTHTSLSPSLLHTLHDNRFTVVVGLLVQGFTRLYSSIPAQTRMCTVQQVWTGKQRLS